ncbi:MAG: hypothetical protein P4L31_05090 [Candidatus Babeliales bacterium]|nr:hypothetical protein [Candidatus Babeliales bacterium]
MKAHIHLLAILLFFSSLRALEPVADNTDLVIFSYDRPMQLYALLESVEEYVTGLASVSVIYRTSNEDFAQGYDQVQARFDNVVYFKQGANPRADFKPLVLKAAFESLHDYILFAVDDDIVKDYVDLNECIACMHKHKAYAFYLRLGMNLTECYSMGSAQRVPQLVQVEHGVYAWRFCDGQHDWGYPNNVDLTLYRKRDIVQNLQSLSYYSPNGLEGIWANGYHSIAHKHGLCYECTKIVNLPLNRVQNECQNVHMNFMTPLELLEKFNQQKKIDIKLLYKIQNKAAHMAYEPVFTDRG